MTSLRKQLDELKALASSLLDTYTFKVSHSKDETQKILDEAPLNESMVIFRLYKDIHD